MINNSTLTAQDMKDRFSNNKNESSTDQQVRDALNDFYSIVERLERQRFPDKGRLKSSALTVGASGTDISTLSNIGSYNVRVYKDTVRTQNILPKRFEGSNLDGYYLLDNQLFITPEVTTDQTLFVFYPKKTTRLSSGTALVTHTLQIDQDLERAVLLYFENVFYDGEHQFDLRNDAEARAIEEIERYFSTNAVPRGY